MKLRKRATGVLGAAVAVCVLAAACSPHAPPPVAPPPSPVARATPPETALERQTRLDFEAAEKSYRAFRAEYMKVAQRGGAYEPTSTMKRFADGPYLEAMVNFTSQTKQAKKRSVGEVEIAYVRPGVYSPKELILNTCEDGTRVRNVDRRGRTVSSGVAARLTLVIRKRQGRWVVWNGDDEKVKSCLG